MIEATPAALGLFAAVEHLNSTARDRIVRVWLVACSDEDAAAWRRLVQAEKKRRQRATQQGDNVPLEQENVGGQSLTVPPVSPAVGGQPLSPSPPVSPTPPSASTPTHEAGLTALSPAGAADPVPYRDVQELFHRLCPSLPRLRETPEHRKKAIRSRWKAANGHALERFTELFTLAESSDFLTGRSGQWSGCSFDWLLNPSNAQKVLEGNYNNDRQKLGAKPNGNYSKSAAGGNARNLIDRNAGTANAGRTSDYSSVGKMAPGPNEVRDVR